MSAQHEADPLSEIDRRWIIACLIAAVAGVAAAFLDFATRDWLEAGGTDAPSGVTRIYAGLFPPC